MVTAGTLNMLFPSLTTPSTFDLSNLAVGCVDCNRWKGVRVDKQYKGTLPIIILLVAGSVMERYALCALSTEEICFCKYLPQDALGKKTYKELSLRRLNARP